jgi:hypothetical protein
MNKEITEEVPIVDGTPLSDNEIALIIGMREFKVSDTLDKLEAQFSAESVNDDNIWKPSYLSWSDVLMHYCYNMANTLPNDIAKAIEQLNMR